MRAGVGIFIGGPTATVVPRWCARNVGVVTVPEGSHADVSWCSVGRRNRRSQPTADLAPFPTLARYMWWDNVTSLSVTMRSVYILAKTEDSDKPHDTTCSKLRVTPCDVYLTSSRSSQIPSLHFHSLCLYGKILNNLV